MSTDFFEYYTYHHEYKEFLSIEECIERIHQIFLKYEKTKVLECISLLIHKTCYKYNFKNLKIINFEYFKKKYPHTIIHRRAIHLLGQAFFSCNNFSSINKNLHVSISDIREIFLLANEILHTVEGSDYDSDLKVLFNTYKFSNDLVIDKDIRYNCFFYSQFYKELKGSKHYDKFNEKFKSTFNFSIEKYAQILKNLYSTRKYSLKKIYKKYFSVNINLTYEKWHERKPMIEIPFEYRVLQKFPFIFAKTPVFDFFPFIFYKTKTYSLCAPHFIMNSIIKKVYTNLSNSRFREEFGNSVEEVIKRFIQENLINNNCQQINLERKNKKGEREYEYGDFGILISNVIFLFEIKAGILGLEKKYEKDINEFQNNFNLRYVEERGVRQQIKKIRDIDSNFKLFCDTTGLNAKLKYQIIPVLLFLDDEFLAHGLNKYLGSEFKRIISEYNIKGNHIVIPKNNSSFTINELKYSKDKLTSPEDVLNSICVYNQLFHKRGIPEFSYEEFLDEVYPHYP